MFDEEMLSLNKHELIIGRIESCSSRQSNDPPNQKVAEAHAEEPSWFAASDFGSFIALAAWLSLCLGKGSCHEH
jgi:hypothetical protein